MGIFDFFLPNVENLEKKKNIRGLVKASRYKKDPEIRRKAAEALRRMEDKRALEGLIYSLENEFNQEVKLALISALEKIPDKKVEKIAIKSLKDSNRDICNTAVSILSKIADRETVELLLEFMKKEPWDKVFSAKEALCKIAGETHTDILLNALEDRKICHYVAEALGNTGDARAVEALLPLLEDGEWIVRNSACMALGRLKAKRAIAGLSKRLYDKETYPRDSAIEALGNFNEDEATEALAKFLSDSFQDDLCYKIISALVKTGNKKAIPCLVKKYRGSHKYKADSALDNFIYQGEPEHQAAYAVAREDWQKVKTLGVVSLLPLFEEYRNCSKQNTTGEQLYGIISSGVSEEKSEEERKGFADKAVSVLLRVINDKTFERSHDIARRLLHKIGPPAIPALISAFKNEKFSATATEALARIGILAVDHLLLCLTDSDPAVSSAAIKTLGIIDDKSAAEALIKILDNRDEKVRKEAAIALGKIKASQATDSLITVLEQDKVIDIRKEAALALGNMGDRKALYPLIKLLEDKNLRASVIIALGGLGDREALEHLLIYLKDDDKDIRRLTVYALGKLKDKIIVEPLLDLLNDSNGGVRESAASVIGNTGPEMAVEPLIKLLKDKEADVRKAAAEALASSGNARAFEGLLSLLNDTDSSVSYAADRAMEKICHLAEPRLQARYAVKKHRWDKALALGKAAVEPLAEAMKDESFYVREEAAKALEKIGVPPDPEIQADYLVIKKDLNKALSLGKAATLPLLCALGDSDNKEIISALGKTGDGRAIPALKTRLYSSSKNTRKDTAYALSSLYRSGKLEEKDKLSIVEVKEVMEQKHEDHTFYSDCNDHKDNMGTGVYL